VTGGSVGMSERLGLPLPVFDAVRAQFGRLLDLPGGPDLDHSAVAGLYPRRTAPAASR
jgi:hypothetical protein